MEVRGERKSEIFSHRSQQTNRMKLEEEQAKVRAHTASAINYAKSAARKTFQVLSQSKGRGNQPPQNVSQCKTMLIPQQLSVERG